MIKKLLIGLFLSGSFCYAVPANVQFTSVNSFVGTPSTSFGSNVTAGDFLTVAIYCQTIASTPTVTDTLNGSFTKDSCFFNSPTLQGSACFFHFSNSASGSDTVSGVCGSAVTGRFNMEEWSGVSNSVVVDTLSVTIGFGGSPFGPTITTTVNNDLVYNNLFNLGNSLGQWNTPTFTALNGSSGATNASADQYLIKTTAGSQASQFVNGNPGAGSWGVGAIAYEPVASAPPPPPSNNRGLYIEGGKFKIQGGRMTLE